MENNATPKQLDFAPQAKGFKYLMEVQWHNTYILGELNWALEKGNITQEQYLHFTGELMQLMEDFYYYMDSHDGEGDDEGRWLLEAIQHGVDLKYLKKLVVEIKKVIELEML